MVADTKLILVYMIIDNDSVKFWLLVTAEYWKKVKDSVSSPTCDYCTRLTVSVWQSSLKLEHSNSGK